MPGLLNIGFAWGGGTLRSRQWLRSIPLQQWIDLLRLPQCRFFALQHGEHAQELEHFCSNERIDVTDLSHVCADIDELAAVVSALDLIVSVDNTLVHLGGALGKPTWVLLPVASESRYPREGERMPWYPSVRLFRHTGPRDATVAMRQMKRELQSEVVGVGRLRKCEESVCAQDKRN